MKIRQDVIGSDHFSASGQRIVDYLNAHTPIPDWSVSRVSGGEQVHVHVHPEGLLEVGVRVPWPETFCSRMTLGALMGELLSSQLAMSRGADRDRRAAEIAEAVAPADVLTGLVDQRGWDILVADAQQRVDAYGDPVAIAVLDLDGLKIVNDTEGHEAGTSCCVVPARRCARSRSLSIMLRAKAAMSSRSFPTTSQCQTSRSTTGDSSIRSPTTGGRIARICGDQPRTCEPDGGVRPSRCRNV